MDVSRMCMDGITSSEFMLRKYLFGLFTFSFGLACGLLFDSFISRLFGETIQNPMLQGAIIILIVVITFFIWRMAEKSNSPKKL